MAYDLNSFYNPDPTTHERVGFIVDDEVVEVENICPKPVSGFQVSGADLLKYGDVASASWHTHPGSTSNLTTEDYETFLAYPKWQHHIVGNDGVTTYYVENGKVLIAS
jgi:hypothetical protein